MFIDIMMALLFALLIEWISLNSKAFKQIVILTICVSIIIIYFASGCQIDFIVDFIGRLDFGVWVIFVILFNRIIMIGINKLINHIKE